MKTLKYFLSIAFLINFSHVAIAQWQPGAVNETGHASIILGIGDGFLVTKTSDLHFGDIKPISGSGGAIAINPQYGTVTILSGNFILSGNTSIATFGLQGPKGKKDYVYTLPTNVVLTSAQGNTMTVNNITVYRNPQSGQAGLGEHIGSGQTTGQGIASISVGGTLNINANQPNGVYSNTTDLKLVIILQ